MRPDGQDVASTTVHMVALLDDPSAVAVCPGQVPGAKAAPESASSEVTRPLPVPIDSARWTWPAGGVQVVVAELLSAKYETTHEPPVVTLNDGDVCVVTRHRLAGRGEPGDRRCRVDARVGGHRQVDLGGRRVGQGDLRVALAEHRDVGVEPGTQVRRPRSARPRTSSRPGRS